jgi:hypothetical protein
VRHGATLVVPGAEPFGQARILPVRTQLGNGIDVSRRPDAAGRRVTDEQPGGTAAEEHEVIEQRSQQPGGGRELAAVRIIHGTGV